MANFTLQSLFKLSDLAPETCRSPEPDPNITWYLTCDENFHYYNDWVIFALVLASTAILFVLSKREDMKKWGSCGGRPGIMYPLNMLDGYDYRLAHAAAFGAMTFELTAILREPNGRNTSFSLGYILSSNPIVSEYPGVRVLVLLVQVVICTFMYYPLFACFSTRYKFFGSILGLVISLYRICAFLWLSSCVNILFTGIFGNNVGKHLLAILIWPNILMLSVLSSQFILTLAQCVKKKEFLYVPPSELIALDHHNERVKYLLGKKPLPWLEKDMHHVSMLNKEKFIQSFSFRRIPGFRFPTRIIATFVVTVIAVYQIGFQVVMEVFGLLEFISRYLRCRDYLFPAVVNEQLAPYKVYIDSAERYLVITVYLWIGIMVVNVLLAVVYIYHSCIVYRRHTMRLYRGDRSMFPKSWVREGSPSMLASASRHAGFQIAYTIWGFVIIQVVSFLLLVAVTFVIIVPMVDWQYFDIAWFILQVIILPLALSQLIYQLQVLVSRFLFLQPKLNPEDSNMPMAIDNRKLWYNQAFFFFFWNLFLGVISALLRIIRGLLFGVFFIPRIDRPVLMKGFETKDTGFYAYLSMLTTLNAHDHPVVKVFVDVLIRSVKEKQARMALYEKKSADAAENGLVMAADIEEVKSNTYTGSKRARYYWSLAYTLINNSDLLAYRKVDDDTGGNEFTKHKIVLAMHRKKQGLSTTNLYEHDNKGFTLDEHLAGVNLNSRL